MAIVKKMKKKSKSKLKTISKSRKHFNKSRKLRGGSDNNNNPNPNDITKGQIIEIKSNRGNKGQILTPGKYRITDKYIANTNIYIELTSVEDPYDNPGIILDTLLAEYNIKILSQAQL